MSQLKIYDGNTWVGIPAGGVGVPSGGSSGQYLKKSSSTDYATEWASLPPQRILVPDYSNGVELQSVWTAYPTSNTTATYTCLSDGYFYIFADRGSQGYTLFLYINGVKSLDWPANIGGMNIAMFIPVRQGDVLNLHTDSTAQTWIVRIANFYPLA